MLRTKARVASFYSFDPLSPFCANWDVGRCSSICFATKTDNRALTMDVTGRNIPPVTSPTVWLFVEVIDTQRLPPRWDTAYLRYALRQAGMIGFYHFDAEWELTSSNANLLMRWISLRAQVLPLRATHRSLAASASH